jgi:alkanesulfonate monooxygenase SsuD/methylene tetrahydromethanopterin reductase-like flavin-dependent oxidoreductase (luciferase family)
VSPDLHLAVALDGTGWHPASWREPAARPSDLFTAGYWTGLVQEAEYGLLDLVTFEDAFRPPDRAPGRLDAVLVATRVAPLTSSIGLVPTVLATLTEPFHVSKAIATLDWVSRGRAGVRIKAPRDGEEFALLGRRTPPGIADAMDEAADHVEVQRRLWDSWEDGAEIRDAATGRFVDRQKLHYIDFEGPEFSVRGPSITPRPPQGQPPVAVLAHRAEPFRLAGRAADLAFVTPHGDAAGIVATIRAEQAAAGRADEPLHVLGDLVVVLDDDASAAADRLARLDAVTSLRSDAEIFAGTPAGLADRLLAWRDEGLAGARLRPAVLADDLPRITRGLVPELQRRDAFRTRYDAATLRGLLGMARPANRYASV